MIFKLFLNDLNSFLSEIYGKTFYYEKKKRFSTVVATENATRYSKKKSNKFTWFHYYGRWALKFYLWCLDNKELLSEIFHTIIDFVFE